MKALHDVVQMGKVRYIGASSMWTYQFVSMQAYAEANNLTKFVSMQNLYNLCYREEEREMNKFCKETGVGIIPWSPMHGGLLARPVGTGDSARAKNKGPMTPVLTDADEETVKRVEKISKDKSWTMPEVSLVWLKQKGATPIVGFNSVARVEEMAGLKGKELTDEEIKFLEEPYVPKNIFGHW
jgi:aryl-alcohol dehydrogenase-like predicted oxidoreductase